MESRKSDYNLGKELSETHLRNRFYVRLEAGTYEATIYFDGKPIAVLKLVSDNIDEARKLVGRVIRAYEDILKVYY